MLDNFQTRKEEFSAPSDHMSSSEDIMDDDDTLKMAVSRPLVNSAGQAEKKTFADLSAIIETGLIVVCLIALFLLLPRNTGGDGWIRYKGLLQIATQHTIPNTKYSLVGPSFALPLIWIGRKLGDPYDWTITYNQILFAVTLLGSYFLLRKHMDRALLRKFYLLLIISSMFVAHLAFFYGEVFTALMVCFGILLTYVRLKVPVGWALIVLGVANTPATLGGLALVVIKKMYDDKRLRYVLALLAAAALIGLVNWLQRGNPLDEGYTNDHGIQTIMPYSGLPGFSYPFLFGVLSLTLSFGKGLLFFAPGLLLPVRQTLRRWQQEKQVPLYQVYTLWIAFVVGLILVYARWWAWSGAIFWGPRFLLAASVPASFALAVRLRDCKESSLVLNLLTFVIFGVSIWVCLNGALYQWLPLPSACSQNNFNLEMMCYYIPEFSILWLPFTHYYALNLNQLLFAGIILISAIYVVSPLCIQLGRQLWEFFKKLSKENIAPGAWRI